MLFCKIPSLAFIIVFIISLSMCTYVHELVHVLLCMWLMCTKAPVKIKGQLCGVAFLFLSYTCSRMELRLLEVVKSTFTHWAISLVPMMKVFACHKSCCTHELTEAVIFIHDSHKIKPLKISEYIGEGLMKSWH